MEVLQRNNPPGIGREPANLSPFDCHREPSARVGGDKELRFDHQTSAPLSHRDPRPSGSSRSRPHVLRYLSSPEITEMLAAWLPASIRALQDYSAQSFWHDVVAGVTVGLVALPLAMAFAIASGLSPQAGIYCAVVTGFTISALGGSRVQIGGPTGAFVVVVAGIVAKYGVSGLFMCTMMAGVMLVILGVTGMGAAVKFLPRPVVIGFTNGIAVLIASTQIRDFLGLRLDRVPAEFLPRLEALASHLDTVNPAAAILGVVALAAIVVLRRAVPAIPGAIVALVAGTAAVMALGLPVETIGSRFGGIPSGFPAPHFPEFHAALIPTLIQPALTVAMLGAIESLMSAVVADRMTGDRHNPNVELVAQGIANIASPMFGGLPATGAIARTATNIRSGARTPVAGMVHAVTLLIVLLVAAPLASYIPHGRARAPSCWSCPTTWGNGTRSRSCFG